MRRRAGVESNFVTRWNFLARFAGIAFENFCNFPQLIGL